MAAAAAPFVPTPFWNASCQQWTTQLWMPTFATTIKQPQLIIATPYKGWFKVNYHAPTAEVKLNAALPSFPAKIIVPLQPRKKRGTKKKIAANGEVVPTKPHRKRKVEEEEEKGVSPSSSAKRAHVEEKPVATEQEKLTWPLRTRRVRVFPNKAQVVKLQKWLGTSRWIYNRALADIKAGKCNLSLEDLQTKHVNGKNFTAANGLVWVLDTPQVIRNSAVDDLAKNYNSNFAKRKLNPALTFDIAFRSKKDSIQSLAVRKKMWNCDRGAFHDVFSPQALRVTKVSKHPDAVHGKRHLAVSGRKHLPAELECDSRLVYERLTDRWWLCLPEPYRPPALPNAATERQGEEDVALGFARADKEPWIAIDPGVRTFITGYDRDGQVVEWGVNDHKRIYRQCLNLDRLQSRMSKANSRHRKRMRRAAARLRQRMKDMVTDLHHKAAKWLCENYGVILLPNFQAGKMSERTNRRIHSKTVRQMLSWAHARFRGILQQKATYYRQCRVEMVREDYTTRTCGRCGVIAPKFSSKVFHCKACQLRADRDHHAARNILLRFLSRR